MIFRWSAPFECQRLGLKSLIDMAIAGFHVVTTLARWMEPSMSVLTPREIEAALSRAPAGVSVVQAVTPKIKRF